MNGLREAHILLVGAGRMGGALAAGWLARGLPAERLRVIDPAPPPEVERLLTEQGVKQATAEHTEGRFDVIVLAVKPQSMDGVLRTVAPLAPVATLALSIAAGTTIAALDRGLGGGRAIVRAMPNTPAAIGRGMTVACPNARVTAAQKELADLLLSAVGHVAWITDEALMDAVTAVSGSGPAYVFLLAECLAAAGAEAGLPPDLAMLLARETVAGAGALLGGSDQPPAALRQNVTSPGGTTAAALGVLMGEQGLGALLQAAVAAAARRSRELRG
jgi:pyrroline-5-carboxylate reductase